MKYHIENRVCEAIYEFLCEQKGLHTKSEESVRRFIEAIWYLMRSGCQWRLLPDYYGQWGAITRETRPLFLPEKNERRLEIMISISTKNAISSSFFGKIKYFRRIFFRFDKMANTFLASLHFVGTLLWLR